MWHFKTSWHKMKVTFGLWFVVEPLCPSSLSRGVAPAPSEGEASVAQAQGPGWVTLFLLFSAVSPGAAAVASKGSPCCW